MKIKMMMLCLALGGWGANAQHNHAKHEGEKMDQSTAMFKDAKLEAAYKHYTHLKDALVASKSDEAKKAAEALQDAFTLVDNGKKAAAEAAKIVAAANLNDQRKAFSNLSNEMVTLIKGGKLSTGMIYLAYCPMANNNEGAFWLSNEAQIKNPYFGNAMLKCGSVKETIQ